MKTVFYNRREAGKRLATKLTAYANHPQAIVLGLARGGVPVAYEIAKTLNLPLDVCLVKKLGLPNDPEIAMGAIVEDALLPNYCGNVTIIDRDTGKIHGVDSEQLRAIVALAKAELRWRERCYRVALMHEGQIQQTGTPAELRNSLGLHRLEVRVDNLEAAEKTLSENPADFADVQTFGDRLDVLVQNPEIGSERIKNAIERSPRFAIAGSQSEINSIRPAEPTLENVFVSRLRQQGFDPPFIPLPRLNPPRTHQKGQIAIGTNNLGKTFGDFQAVKGVTLEIGYGEIYGLLGANGAGKTTTIKMLCGLLDASSGDIVLAGQTSDLRSSELRQRLGYMSQKFTL